MCNPVCVPEFGVVSGPLWTCQRCGQPYSPVPTWRGELWAPIRGKRAYHVRQSLKRLGARWDPPGKTWWVPNLQLEAAIDLVKFGPDDLDDAANDAQVSGDLWLCWECGDRLQDIQLRKTLSERAPDFAQLLDVAYWCGCTD